MHLVFHRMAVGKRDVHQYNPIAAHIQCQLPLVSSRAGLPRLTKDWSHAGMRHVAFKGNMGPRNWFFRVGQTKAYRDRPNPRWLRSELLISDIRQPGRARATGRQQQ